MSADPPLDLCHEVRRKPLATVHLRFRGQFAYVDGELPDQQRLPLCRLRYGGSASRWGFAIYLASRDGYEDSILPTGLHAGSPEALDCACGLYLSVIPPGFRGGFGVPLVWWSR